jgi:chorismate dehydratase
VHKYRISAVSYTNTAPFVYGIKHSDILDQIDLSLDIPSVCANKLIHDEADIGLVPVAALLQIPDYHILSDYCIGAKAAVNSVFIFSHKPVSEISTLRLDNQSRTSNALARVLLKNFWKKEPQYLAEGEADAFVEIGDRTFGKKDQYDYAYDLGQAWNEYTGLPFAFAVWASNKPVDADFVQEFNRSLQLGLDSRDKVLDQLPANPDFDLHTYLYHNLDYQLDEGKKKAIGLFLNLVRKL